MTLINFSLLNSSPQLIDTLLILTIHASPIFDTFTTLIFPTLKHFLTLVHLLLKLAYSSILHSVPQLTLSSPAYCPPAQRISSVRSGFTIHSRLHGLNTDAMLMLTGIITQTEHQELLWGYQKSNSQLECSIL